MGDEIIFFLDSDFKKTDDEATEPTTTADSQLLDYYQQKSDAESPTITVGEVRHLSQEHLDFELGLLSPHSSSEKKLNFGTPRSKPCTTELHSPGTPTPDSPEPFTPHSSCELPETPHQSPGDDYAAAPSLPPAHAPRCSRSMSSPPAVSTSARRVSPTANEFVPSSKSFTVICSQIC